MAINLISSNFLSKTPQRLKKLWEVGLRHKSAAANPKAESKDEYFFEKAKQQTYRSRSVHKLIIFDQKYNLLKPGCKVLDIGAAPGSWSQYLATRTNANHSDPNSPVGSVVAVDLQMFEDIDGVTSLPNTDFLKESSQKKIVDAMANRARKFDFIFSDMTSQTGVPDYDENRLKKLAYSVVLFSVKYLKQDGGVLIKVWNGDKGEFKKDMKNIFGSVSFDGFMEKGITFSETYFVGRNYSKVNK